MVHIVLKIFSAATKALIQCIYGLLQLLYQVFQLTTAQLVETLRKIQNSPTTQNSREGKIVPIIIIMKTGECAVLIIHRNLSISLELSRSGC